MNEAVQQIRDIHGFAGVPWWPPGPGWWVLAGGLILLALLAISLRWTPAPAVAARAAGRAGKGHGRLPFRAVSRMRGSMML